MHCRVVAYLTLRHRKGYSPSSLVQSSLSLFDDDLHKAEQFLAAHKTVSQLGFSDLLVREALFMYDCNTEEAIRYLLTLT